MYIDPFDFPEVPKKDKASEKSFPVPYFTVSLERYIAMFEEPYTEVMALHSQHQSIEQRWAPYADKLKKAIADRCSAYLRKRSDHYCRLSSLYEESYRQELLALTWWGRRKLRKVDTRYPPLTPHVRAFAEKLFRYYDRVGQRLNRSSERQEFSSRFTSIERFLPYGLIHGNVFDGKWAAQWGQLESSLLICQRELDRQLKGPSEKVRPSITVNAAQQTYVTKLVNLLEPLMSSEGKGAVNDLAERMSDAYYAVLKTVDEVLEDMLEEFPPLKGNLSKDEAGNHLIDTVGPLERLLAHLSLSASEHL